MPSGKRETERKGNTPVNTGPSPNSDGRANNLVEEADEPARGSGPPTKPGKDNRGSPRSILYKSLDSADLEYQPLVIVDEVGNETSASV
ncbi:hypothetical protein T09_3252 [Trichinella sp. T9]|nr:hypothetical protein T09_3252 [Trichinella sp. T9]